MLILLDIFIMGGKKMKVEFMKEKETKNTIRFKEVVAGDLPPVIGTIYIPKQTLQDLEYRDGDAVVVELTIAR